MGLIPMSDHTGIAVLESGWWRKSNTSIRGLFDLIANISHNNPNAYHYEMANSEYAIKEAIPRIASYRECRYLYVACHGDTDGLCLLNGDKLKRSELRNLLVRVNETKGSKLRGLHMGSCLFTTDRIAGFLFEKDVGLTWVAGYFEEVDWLESSALDLLFFNELLKYNGSSDLSTIEKTAEAILAAASGLVCKLGFGIFIRGRNGVVKNLVEMNEDSADEEES